MQAKIYIARHERHEAAEAYANRLTIEQLEYLKETEGDFWLYINQGKGELHLIEIEV